VTFKGTLPNVFLSV